jgi:voltage-gated potassium channel
VSDQNLTEEKEALDRERLEILEQVEDWLELPVLVLGFVWLLLLVVELIWGLTPLLETFVFAIWGIFVVDFVIRLILAPQKLIYLRNNWLTVLSLIIPAFRVLRFVRVARLLRVARATRGLRLVRVVGSLNRGMRALRSTMRRRGFGYAIVLTLIVALVGAAGMYTFEQSLMTGQGFASYADALWWTAMILTTIGSDFWPQTAEGRILTFLLSVYGFAIFGYMTATLASFFIGRDAESEEGDLIGPKNIEALRFEIQGLREEIQRLSDKPD